MQKRPFYFDNTTEYGSVLFRPWNLRHRYIEWHLAKYPVGDEDMPAGEWIVTLKWHRSIIPGLLFREA